MPSPSPESRCPAQTDAVPMEALYSGSSSSSMCPFSAREMERGRLLFLIQPTKKGLQRLLNGKHGFRLQRRLQVPVHPASVEKLGGHVQLVHGLPDDVRRL
ncbi:MAG: hypothetical protein ACLUE8_11240 [Lachnospiraceae bacterium]